MKDQESALRLHSVIADRVRSICTEVSREAKAGGPDEYLGEIARAACFDQGQENARVREVALLLELDYQFSFFALKLDKETSVLNLSLSKTWYEYR